MHVLPAGFHRIRYYGLLASGKRVDDIARARELLTLPIIAVNAVKAVKLTIAADPKHLGARIGILSVLHTWGSG
jgi:hypothetical protein